MIYDLKTTFLDGYNFATSNIAAAATTAIGNVIDIGSVLQTNLTTGTANNVTPQWPNGGTAGLQPKDLGPGEDMWLVFRVRNNGTAVTTQANGLTFKLTTDSNPNLTTAPVDLAISATFTGGNASGSIIMITALPVGTTKQYLGIKAVNGATTAIAAGTVDAFITHDISRWIGYGQPNLN